MRILVTYRGSAEQDGFDTLRDCLAEHSLLPVADPVERTAVMSDLIGDMSEADKHRFQITLREIYQDPTGGTVASVSVLPERYLLLRLRNDSLRKLMPGGHRLIAHVMRAHGPDGTARLEMKDCEVRERGRPDGFLYGTWHGGERNYFRFLFAQRRAWFIVALFTIGLIIEVIFSFTGGGSEVGQLSLRLSAPALVSSLVLLLERLAQWRDQRQPRLYWETTRQDEQGEDTFQIAPSQ